MKVFIQQSLCPIMKYLFQIFLIQAMFTFVLFANEGNAQIKSVKETRIDLNIKGLSLDETFEEIEKQTGYTFSYDAELISSAQNTSDLLIDYKKKNVTVEKFLLHLSKESKLQFKQVNEVINVKQIQKNDLSASIEVEMEDISISGVVNDEDGNPLPGATILVKGSSEGTVTDIDGRYSLNVPDGTEYLTFSFVGYESQEVQINGRTVIDVSLSVDLQNLDEVVVVGYGQKSRKLMTESISTINSEKIKELPVASFDQALQGRMSGVQITNLDGTPGSPTSIRIRGVGTIANAQPLFVIDGIPVGTGTGGVNGTSVNPLSTINPSDIESISVLKDASAAAVYGVRAANGVVLVTTKRGRQGKPTISFDAYYGIQQLPELYNMNNTDQYIEISQEAFDNYNSEYGYSVGDPEFRALHPDLQAGSRYRDINTPWVDDITKDAPSQNYNLSVSGGTDKLNYHISTAYLSQEAVVDRWDLERYSFRANSDYQVNDRIKFGQTFNISNRIIERGMSGGGDGYLLSNAASMPPFFEIYENEFNTFPENRYGYSGNFNVANMTIQNANGVNQIVDNLSNDVRILGGLNAEVMIIKGLTFKSAASIDLSFSRSESWSPGYTGQELGIDRSQNNYNDSRGTGSTQVYTNTLNYQNTFGKHSVSALAGIEAQIIKGSSLSARNTDFISTDPDFYRILKNGSGTPEVFGGANEQAFLGYVGRLSYNYDEKYLLTATIRRDGTSTFSPVDNRQWGTFPSLSAAWRVDQEDFFGKGIIQQLKVRGSWGQLGNSFIAAVPPYAHVVRVSTTPDYGLNGSNTVQAPAPINFVNETVTWETVETIDGGVDVSLLNNKLRFLGTYYYRTTKDFLVSLDIPATSGFTGTADNFGEIVNKGFEFEVDYSDKFGDLFFGVSGNLTTVDNELISISEGVTEYASGDYRTAVGYPIGYFYGYQTAGLYQTQTEVDNALDDSNVTNQGLRGPGDVIFVDNNGPADPNTAQPGQLFSGEPDGEITPEDRTYLGKTIPDFYYGLNFDLNYKNFDFSILFQGVGGIQLYNQFRRQRETITGESRNLMSSVLSRWTGEGTSNDMPRAIQTDPNQNNRFSDRWIEDADFFRLKNIQLGYTLPESVRDVIGIVSGRIYVAATNLLTITQYSGPDPEVATPNSNRDQLESGTDEGTIPQTRNYRVGIQIQF